MAVAIKMKHTVDPREEIHAALAGKGNGMRVLGAKVLVATYIRPEQTASGIILADKTRDEERYQGKVGLLLDHGPLAFVDDADHKWEVRPKQGDWVLFNVGDTRRLMIGKVDCRMLEDVHVQAIVTHPDDIY